MWKVLNTGSGISSCATKGLSLSQMPVVSHPELPFTMKAYQDDACLIKFIIGLTSCIPKRTLQQIELQFPFAFTSSLQTQDTCNPDAMTIVPVAFMNLSLTG
jgi:hypothetical protein